MVNRSTAPRPPPAGSMVPTFVTVKGGGYFFMPAISALRCLTTAP